MSNVSGPIGQAQQGQTTFLENFQDNILDYLYDLEPPANNLFWAGNFQTFINGSTGSSYGEDELSLPNAQFRIKKITLDSPGLEFFEPDNKHTFQVFVKSAKPVQEVKIDFRDDFAHSVKRYHYNWLKYWYHRKHGVFRVGAYGKLRGLDIILFHYLPLESNSNAIQSLPTIKPILGIQLRGMVPSNLSGWEFDTDAPNNEQLFSVDYKLNNAPQFYWFDHNNKPVQTSFEDAVVIAKTAEQSYSIAESAYSDNSKAKTAFDTMTFA